MKKILGLLMALVMMIMVAGCGSTNNDDNDLLAKIKKDGVIKIGTNSGYPPYEFYDTSNNQKKLVGYDIDLGNKIAEKLGVKVEWVDIDFDALVGSLQSGKFDIIMAGMVDTSERRQSIDFSDRYYQSQTVAVVKKGAVNDYKDVSQYEGKTIVVQSGTTQADTAKAVKGANVLELPSVTDTIAALTSGKADALFIAEVSAENIVAKYPAYAYTPITGIEDALLNDGASIGIPKNQANLEKELNKIIKDLKESGELDRMFNDNVALYEKLK